MRRVTAPSLGSPVLQPRDPSPRDAYVPGLGPTLPGPGPGPPLQLQSPSTQGGSPPLQRRTGSGRLLGSIRSIGVVGGGGAALFNALGGGGAGSTGPGGHTLTLTEDLPSGPATVVMGSATSGHSVAQGPPPRTTLAQYQRAAASSGGDVRGGHGHGSSRPAIVPGDPHVTHIKPANALQVAMLESPLHRFGGPVPHHAAMVGVGGPVGPPRGLSLGLGLGGGGIVGGPNSGPRSSDPGAAAGGPVGSAGQRGFALALRGGIPSAHPAVARLQQHAAGGSGNSNPLSRTGSAGSAGAASASSGRASATAAAAAGATGLGAGAGGSPAPSFVGNSRSTSAMTAIGSGRGASLLGAGATPRGSLLSTGGGGVGGGGGAAGIGGGAPSLPASVGGAASRQYSSERGSGAAFTDRGSGPALTERGSGPFGAGSSVFTDRASAPLAERGSVVYGDRDRGSSGVVHYGERVSAPYALPDRPSVGAYGGERVSGPYGDRISAPVTDRASAGSTYGRTHTASGGTWSAMPPPRHSASGLSALLGGGGAPTGAGAGVSEPGARISNNGGGHTGGAGLGGLTAGGSGRFGPSASFGTGGGGGGGAGPGSAYAVSGAGNGSGGGGGFLASCLGCFGRRGAKHGDTEAGMDEFSSLGKAGMPRSVDTAKRVRSSKSLSRAISDTFMIRGGKMAALAGGGGGSGSRTAKKAAPPGLSVQPQRSILKSSASSRRQLVDTLQAPLPDGAPPAAAAATSATGTATATATATPALTGAASGRGLAGPGPLALPTHSPSAAGAVPAPLSGDPEVQAITPMRCVDEAEGCRGVTMLGIAASAAVDRRRSDNGTAGGGTGGAPYRISANGLAIASIAEGPAGRVAVEDSPFVHTVSQNGMAVIGAGGAVGPFARTSLGASGSLRAVAPSGGAAGETWGHRTSNNGGGPSSRNAGSGSPAIAGGGGGAVGGGGSLHLTAHRPSGWFSDSPHAGSPGAGGTPRDGAVAVGVTAALAAAPAPDQPTSAPLGKAASSLLLRTTSKGVAPSNPHQAGQGSASPYGDGAAPAAAAAAAAEPSKLSTLAQRISRGFSNRASLAAAPGAGPTSAGPSHGGSTGNPSSPIPGGGGGGGAGSLGRAPSRNAILPIWGPAPAGLGAEEEDPLQAGGPATHPPELRTALSRARSQHSSRFSAGGSAVAAGEPSPDSAFAPIPIGARSRPESPRFHSPRPRGPGSLSGRPGSGSIGLPAADPWGEGGPGVGPGLEGFGRNSPNRVSNNPLFRTNSRTASQLPDSTMGPGLGLGLGGTAAGALQRRPTVGAYGGEEGLGLQPQLSSGGALVGAGSRLAPLMHRLSMGRHDLRATVPGPSLGLGLGLGGGGDDDDLEAEQIGADLPQQIGGGTDDTRGAAAAAGGQGWPPRRNGAAAAAGGGMGLGLAELRSEETTGEQRAELGALPDGVSLSRQPSRQQGWYQRPRTTRTQTNAGFGGRTSHGGGTLVSVNGAAAAGPAAAGVTAWTADGAASAGVDGAARAAETAPVAPYFASRDGVGAPSISSSGSVDGVLANGAAAVAAGGGRGVDGSETGTETDGGEGSRRFDSVEARRLLAVELLRVRSVGIEPGVTLATLNAEAAAAANELRNAQPPNRWPHQPEPALPGGGPSGGHPHGGGWDRGMPGPAMQTGSLNPRLSRTAQPRRPSNLSHSSFSSGGGAAGHSPRGPSGTVPAAAPAPASQPHYLLPLQRQASHRSTAQHHPARHRLAGSGLVPQASAAAGGAVGPTAAAGPAAAAAAPAPPAPVQKSHSMGVAAAAAAAAIAAGMGGGGGAGGDAAMQLPGAPSAPLPPPPARMAPATGLPLTEAVLKASTAALRRAAGSESGAAAAAAPPGLHRDAVEAWARIHSRQAAAAASAFAAAMGTELGPIDPLDDLSACNEAFGHEGGHRTIKNAEVAAAAAAASVTAEPPAPGDGPAPAPLWLKTGSGRVGARHNPEPQALEDWLHSNNPAGPGHVGGHGGVGSAAGAALAGGGGGGAGPAVGRSVAGLPLAAAPHPPTRQSMPGHFVRRSWGTSGSGQ